MNVGREYKSMDWKHAFQELCNRYGIFMFLDGGTLLGAVRDSGFIEDDLDIDTATLDADEKRIESLKAEWRIIGEKEKFWSEKCVSMGICNYHRIGDYYVHR